jgi:hypothetical protein
VPTLCLNRVELDQVLVEKLTQSLLGTSCPHVVFNLWVVGVCDPQRLPQTHTVSGEEKVQRGPLDDSGVECRHRMILTTTQSAGNVQFRGFTFAPPESDLTMKVPSSLIMSLRDSTRRV